MIDIIPLFFSQKLNSYVLEFNNNSCFFCKKELFGISHILKVSGKTIEVIEYCSKCKGKALDYAKLNINCDYEYYNVLITNILPYDITPVIIRHTELKISKDIGGLASNNKIKEYETTETKVFDKTRLSNIQSFEGCKIGDHSKINDVLIAKNEALELEGVKSYLSEFKEIEFNETKRIDKNG